MIQLQILSGNMAGDIHVVRHFPFRVGRAAENDLVLDDPGVWDRHLTLKFAKGEGFLLETAPETFAAINAQPQNSARLRNGDVISFGSAKIQFWISAPHQQRLLLRELSFWLLLATVTACQLFLIYRLLK